MRISVAIEHHPSRRDLVSALRAAVAPLEAEVISDPEPERRRPATWPTYRLALEATPADATHRLVLQDDVVPCASFASVLSKVIAVRPDSLIALCVCTNLSEVAQDVLRARDSGDRFLDLDRCRWIPTLALVWPVGLISRVLEAVDRARWPEDFLADDEVVWRAMLAIGIVPVATVPSIVEHPDLVPSVRRARRPRVTAAWFLEDPAGLDWAATAPPRRPAEYLSRRT